MQKAEAIRLCVPGLLMRYNHGNGSFDDYNDFIRCADIHMEREYGLKRRDDEK